MAASSSATTVQLSSLQPSSWLRVGLVGLPVAGCRLYRCALLANLSGAADASPPAP